MAAFSNIVADLIARKPQVVEACEAILHELLDSSTMDEKRKRLEQEGDATPSASINAGSAASPISALVT